ncbi:hypothetical protein [Pseudomonas sp. Pseu.R1]|uniref:hypothetical protein n=1 Tax=Pseudomonas sp. Pseu.R1 TaxID=3379818 RepID=UPI003B95D2B8
MKCPSDREILSIIYKMYYEEFQNFSHVVESGRASKIYIQISCQAVAERLNVDKDIVFGRLYYHLQKKHGYTQDDGSKVLFFGTVENDLHCVNFPLLGSVLAGLQEEASKFRLATGISFLAMAVAIVALFYKP